MWFLHQISAKKKKSKERASKFPKHQRKVPFLAKYKRESLQRKDKSSSFPNQEGKHPLAEKNGKEKEKMQILLTQGQPLNLSKTLKEITKAFQHLKGNHPHYQN